jgi:hypothetical protein
VLFAFLVPNLERGWAKLGHTWHMHALFSKLEEECPTWAILGSLWCLEFSFSSLGGKPSLFSMMIYV